MAHDHSNRDSFSAGTRVLLGAVSTLAISFGVVVTSSAAVNDHPPAAPSTQEATLPAAVAGVQDERIAAVDMFLGRRHKTQGHALKLESRQHKTRANHAKIEWERRHHKQGVGWSWGSHQHKTQAHFLKFDGKPHGQR
ncbi:MAG: hypothetical protein KGR48_04705 [Alphaproteobacteria bacterium]|nr:hypothetical protein [Alphaproteobacteria bacterium]MDE2014549.1 hypothetical protein [Alphaproteobacteria bacterium]MDE2074765.1 hypothetical protein [Alphaproteobacteria bacterium]